MLKIMNKIAFESYKMLRLRLNSDAERYLYC